MSIVTSQEMFAKAYAGGYAIGAFNVNNMEIIQGITEAAKECNAPVILQVSSGARKYANRTYLVKLVEAAVIETGLPICLHLDHGDSFELCKACVDDGFSSVMIDASSKPFEENVALTRQVVEYAHAHGAVVEAELGTLAGIEDDVKVRPRIRPIRARRMCRNLLSVPAAIHSQSQSARATAPISSSPEQSRSSGLTFSRKFPSACPASRSCCMARRPCRRNMFR